MHGWLMGVTEEDEGQLTMLASVGWGRVAHHLGYYKVRERASGRWRGVGRARVKVESDDIRGETAERGDRAWLRKQRGNRAGVMLKREGRAGMRLQRGAGQG